MSRGVVQTEQACDEGFPKGHHLTMNMGDEHPVAPGGVPEESYYPDGDDRLIRPCP